MQVDVAGTAKGVWAETGVTEPVAGDDRRYIALVDYRIERIGHAPGESPREDDPGTWSFGAGAVSIVR